SIARWLDTSGDESEPARRWRSGLGAGGYGTVEAFSTEHFPPAMERYRAEYGHDLVPEPLLIARMPRDPIPPGAMLDGVLGGAQIAGQLRRVLGIGMRRGRGDRHRERGRPDQEDEGEQKGTAHETTSVVRAISRACRGAERGGA
ncbi:MAG: hypothetical protein AAGC67_22720, partial [Myxococcota bacterium]